jgi:hypothetical protein
MPVRVGPVSFIMIKIWLDDERDPADNYIQENFGSSSDMIWVKTAHAAINRLKDNNVSFISLDHDLGPPNCGTGLDVAKWIEEQAFNGKLNALAWAVHSMNVIGSKNITRAMQNADKFWHLQGFKNAN